MCFLAITGMERALGCAQHSLPPSSLLWSPPFSSSSWIQGRGWAANAISTIGHPGEVLVCFKFGFGPAHNHVLLCQSLSCHVFPSGNLRRVREAVVWAMVKISAGYLAHCHFPRVQIVHKWQSQYNPGVVTIGPMLFPRSFLWHWVGSRGLGRNSPTGVLEEN